MYLKSQWFHLNCAGMNHIDFLLPKKISPDMNVVDWALDILIINCVRICLLWLLIFHFLRVGTILSFLPPATLIWLTVSNHPRFQPASKPFLDQTVFCKSIQLCILFELFVFLDYAGLDFWPDSVWQIGLVYLPWFTPLTCIVNIWSPRILSLSF